MTSKWEQLGSQLKMVKDSRGNYRYILKVKEEDRRQLQVTGMSALAWALKEVSECILREREGYIVSAKGTLRWISN